MAGFFTPAQEVVDNTQNPSQWNQEKVVLNQRELVGSPFRRPNAGAAGTVCSTAAAVARSMTAAAAIARCTAAAAAAAQSGALIAMNTTTTAVRRSKVRPDMEGDTALTSLACRPLGAAGAGQLHQQPKCHN